MHQKYIQFFFLGYIPFKSLHVLHITVEFMYKCKICVSFVIYVQILPWNKVALSPPPHLQMK